MWRAARWFIVIVGGVLMTLWVIVAVGSRTPAMHDALVRALADKLDADVELQSFEVATFPRIRIHGDGLRVRLRGQVESAPLIDVAHFEVVGGMMGMLHRPRRFDKVTLDGLRITIPPRSSHDRESGAKAALETVEGPIVIQHVETKNATLVLIPRDSRKEPRVWDIAMLDMDFVGFNRSMPFTATLTNPIPRGNIAVTGTFGPWRSRDPGSTPLSGRYAFTDVDLGTIDGIGGSLASEGDFAGLLSRIDVRGTTSSPDFQVDVAGQPVPLDTRFHAVVDGTDGDTYLPSVEARILDTLLTASGAVLSTPGVKGRTVRLQVDMPHGRLQDVLKLGVRSRQPVMTGEIGLRTSFLLPPGREKVADRLQLGGEFALNGTKFTDPGVHEQLVALSRRSQGKGHGEPIERVVSDMRGKFVLRNGTLRLDPLTFAVPGADVRLIGTYRLRSGTLDLTGTLAMEAPVSKAVGGVKGFFLKVADPLFHRHGAGALLPIRISGTREKPQFHMRWGAVFSKDPSRSRN
jgi:hypothetical protein